MHSLFLLLLLGNGGRSNPGVSNNGCGRDNIQNTRFPGAMPMDDCDCNCECDCNMTPGFDARMDPRMDTRDNRMDPRMDIRDNRMDSRMDNRMDSRMDARDMRMDNRMDNRDNRMDSRPFMTFQGGGTCGCEDTTSQTNNQSFP